MGVMIFVLGACGGSFVNMLVYRTAVKYKLKKPISKFQKTNKSQITNHNNQNRSFCDFCGRQLHWYENVPIISWVIQRGKSRCCGKKLSVLYPIVETMLGLLFLQNFQITNSNFQNYSQLILSMVIITLMMFSAVFDLKYFILPDFATGLLIVLSIILLVGRWPASPLLEILSAFGAVGFLGFLYLITKGKGMGFGDVKLAIFMGLLLGFPKIIIACYVAFIVGAVVGVGMMLWGKAGQKTMIPFGPFLLLGTLVAWWWGGEIIRMWLRIFL